MNLETIDVVKLNQSDTEKVYAFLLTQPDYDMQRFLVRFFMDKRKASWDCPFMMTYRKWRKSVEPPKCRITLFCESVLDMIGNGTDDYQNLKHNLGLIS